MARTPKVSKQKRRNTWYLVYRPPGSSKQKWEPAGTDEAEAERLRLQKAADLAQPSYVEPRRDSFATVSDEWYDLVAQARCVESTLIDYKSILRCHIWPVFSDEPISKPDYRDILLFVRGLQSKVGPKRLRNIMIVLSDVFEYARKAGYRKDNPVRGVELPRLTKREVDCLGPDELWRLIVAVREVDPFNAPLVETAIFTGLRMGELRSLVWQNVDFQAKVLKVRRSQARRVAGGPKTAAGFRNIPLSDYLVEILARQHASNHELTELVFPSGKLTPFDQGHIRTRVLYRALEHAGLRRVTFHSLRHSAASMLIHSGATDKAVQTIMGHANISITKDIYGHLFADAEREAISLMTDQFMSKKPDQVEEDCAIYRPEAVPILLAVKQEEAASKACSWSEDVEQCA